MADNKHTCANENLRNSEGPKVTIAGLRGMLEADSDLKVPSVRTLQSGLKLLAQEVDLEVTEDDRTLNYSHPRGIKHWIQPGLGEKESLLLIMAQSHLGHLLPADLQQLLVKQFHRAGQILDLEKPTPHRANDAISRAQVQAIVVASPRLAFSPAGNIEQQNKQISLLV